jgi:hypothetical protein
MEQNYGWHKFWPFCFTVWDLIISFSLLDRAQPVCQDGRPIIFMFKKNPVEGTDPSVLETISYPSAVVVLSKAEWKTGISPLVIARSGLLVVHLSQSVIKLLSEAQNNPLPSSCIMWLACRRRQSKVTRFFCWKSLSKLKRRIIHNGWSGLIFASLHITWFRRKLRGDWIRVMLATILSATFCLLVCCLKT